MQNPANPISKNSEATKNEPKIIVVGGRPLYGIVRTEGAKNAVLKMMAAAILAKDVCVIKNVPNLSDVHMMSQLMINLGARVEFKNHELTIDTTDMNNFEASYEYVSKLRASFVVLGPLLARFKQAKVSLPGGCAIGERRIDLHERGLKMLGAEVVSEHGYVCAKTDKLVGTKIYLDRPSNGATENIMLASVFAEGQTIIENAAQDPEIVNIADFLNAMGAKVTGAGSYQIVIDGINESEIHGATIDTIPDRLEAGTFLLAPLATGGEVTVTHCNPHHLYSLISKITEMGAEVSIYAPDVIKVKMTTRPKPIDVTTHPYPGFPTDLQAPVMTVQAIADGTSIMTETIYENRFMQVAELRRMGADITIKGNAAVVKGIPKLTGAEVKSSDLRAGAAMVLAGLSAEGISEVTGLNHIDRGYEDFEGKLLSLGANIKRI